MTYIFGGPDEPPPVEGVFISRPNRFIIIAEMGDETVRVHCPNPGRIWEILHPGRKLILTPSVTPERKTPYSLAAACYKKKTIPMNAGRSNKITKELIIPHLFPDAEDIKGEYSLPKVSTAGSAANSKIRSRFDFLVKSGNKDHLIEVKSCTLTERGVAMFPDAPTERGRRHVEELMEIQNTGAYECHIILVLHHADTRLFIPNFHTDPDFAFTLEEASKSIKIHAVSVETDQSGSVTLINPDLPIDFTPLKAAKADRGFYILLLHTPAGIDGYEEGWYGLIEGVDKGLRKGLERRLKRKQRSGNVIEKMNFHADERKGIPVYSLQDLTQRAMKEFSSLSDEVVVEKPFLIFFKENPIFNREFTEVLFRYRHLEALIT
ncbi:MAG: DNA/RNA nuclease SfsA [Spirochaetales bacterium]|nr:DNA/RNA nuclease SfsA [Spirochaetales bacterium]